MAMQILHLLYTKGTFLLWAEGKIKNIDCPAPAVSQNKLFVHPYALSSAELVHIVSTIAESDIELVEGIAATCVLPSNSKGPIPSSPLLETEDDQHIATDDDDLNESNADEEESPPEAEDSDETEEVAELRSWLVPTLSVPVDILHHILVSSHHAYGICTGAEISFSRRLFQFAATIVQKQSFIPSIKEFSHDGNSHEMTACAVWEPVCSGILGEDLSSISASLPTINGFSNSN